MEDRYANMLNIENNVSFYGVFDGHAGSHTAQMLSEHLFHVIIENEDFSNKEYISSLIKGFVNMDNRLSTDSRVHIDISGSTGIVIMIDEEDNIHSSWLGDSRAVISHNGIAQNLTYDHLPTNPEEYLRIKRANMFVSNDRVNGSLAMSRAFGDFIFKQHEGLSPENQAVSCRPDVYRRKVDYAKDEFIVLGSDGLWEMLDGQQVVDFVRSRLASNSDCRNLSSTLEATVMDLIDMAVTDDIMNEEGVGCDNITATLILISNSNWESQDQNNNKATSSTRLKEPKIFQSFQHMIEPPSNKGKNKKDSANQVQKSNGNRMLQIPTENLVETDNVTGIRELKRCDPDFEFPTSLYNDLYRKCSRSKTNTNVPKLFLNSITDQQATDYV